jgi:hypothetical protein
MNADNRQERIRKGAETSVSTRAIRKKYTRPELVVYGSLVELTGINGNDSLDPAFAGSRQTG